MAKVEGYNPPPEIQALIDKSLQPNWSFDVMMLELKNRGLSREKLAALQGRSTVKLAALHWWARTPEERDLYKFWGEYQKVSGWVVGLMQYCARSKLGFAAMPYASSQHAGNAACILSLDSGETVEFRQAHPLVYYAAVKVPGKRNRFMPQEIGEDYPDGVQLKMTMAYGSEHDTWFLRPWLAEKGPNARIRITVRHYRNVFRGSVFRDFRHDFDLDQPFENIEINGDPNWSSYAGYDLIVNVRDIEGIVLFDTVELNHGGMNFARDWRCKNPAARFQGHLKNVLPNWERTIGGPGTKIYARGYGID